MKRKTQGYAVARIKLQVSRSVSTYNRITVIAASGRYYRSTLRRSETLRTKSRGWAVCVRLSFTRWQERLMGATTSCQRSTRNITSALSDIQLT